MDVVLERKPHILAEPPAPFLGKPALLPIGNEACFTHASLSGMPAYEFEAPPDVRLDDYERLETQGDSIIQLSLTLRIFQLYPRLSPGGATAIRAALDCNEHLAIMADQYGLPEKLRAIRGSLDRFRTLPTVRADLFKAYVASAFHDHGWQVTHDWLCQAFDADIRNAYAKLKRAADLRATAASNNVTAECVSLLELWKGRDPMNRIVSYEDIGVSGTAHAPTFEVVCKINGELKGTGIGTKKKKAKAIAAEEAAIHLGLLGGEYIPL